MGFAELVPEIFTLAQKVSGFTIVVTLVDVFGNANLLENSSCGQGFRMHLRNTKRKGRTYWSPAPNNPKPIGINTAGMQIFARRNSGRQIPEPNLFEAYRGSLSPRYQPVI